jgi:translation initiation factor 3 subunit C
MSSGDEAPPKPTTSTAKPAMSRFLRTAGSDSSSESEEDESESDESDVPQKRGLPLRDESDEEESDDEEKPTARIMSAQEKRLAEIEATGRVIDNGLKNDDWVVISNGVIQRFAFMLANISDYRIR